MTVLRKILFDEVIANPAGSAWESLAMPVGKKILIRELGCSVGNGTVFFYFGSEIIRVIADGTYEMKSVREFISGIGDKFKIHRINNSGTPRVISAWIDALIED
jgi:hypothetical protein